MRLIFAALFFLALTTRGLSGASNDMIVSRIPRTKVESSAITSIGYSKRLRALEIEFRNGAIYRYLEVPIDTYHELMAAASKASYYDANIRNHYRSVHVKSHAGR